MEVMIWVYLEADITPIQLLQLTIVVCIIVIMEDQEIHITPDTAQVVDTIILMGVMVGMDMDLIDLHIIIIDSRLFFVIDIWLLRWLLCYTYIQCKIFTRF